MQKTWPKILAFLLCIALLAFGLVACKPKPVDPTPEPPTAAELFEEMFANIQESFVIDDARNFYVDAKATAELSGITPPPSIFGNMNLF